MFETGLLILTRPIPVLRKQVTEILSEASKVISNTLYIHIQPHNNSEKSSWLQSTYFSPDKNFRLLMTELYSSGVSVCGNIDIYVLQGNIQNKHKLGKSTGLGNYSFRKNLEIVLMDDKQKIDDNNASLREFVQSTFSPTVDNLCYNCLQHLSSCEEAKNESESLGTHRQVVLGGTFDRLHAGHKILLGEGCLLAEERLTVGVTDGDMNLKKTLPELMLPIKDRIDSVENFIATVKPQISHRVVPITDMYGPTITDPDLQCIVVSAETEKGGQMVNNERQKKGYPLLEQHVIGLVEDKCHNQFEETKVSSSSLRKRLLGTVINPIQPNLMIPASPYIIGLTGGIASGKSAICQRLQGLGAGTVDCDKLGHQAYVKGSPAYEKLIATFGSEIINKSGEINRQALGAIVFSDQAQMETLNSIVWPEIAKLAETEIQKYRNDGKKVVILEAAVLLQAGWETMCHEVWNCIIPVKEAVQRLSDRNKLSEDEALKRINSQISNEERVQKSNVVLCSQWEYEYTQQQVLGVEGTKRIPIKGLEDKQEIMVVFAGGKGMEAYGREVTEFQAEV